MNYRLRLKLFYKDGTTNELIIRTPPEVANEIQRKGMLAAEIYVDENIQSFGGFDIEDFKKNKGGVRK